MIKKIFQNKVFKNASWLTFGKIFQMVISLVVGIFTARYLGPSNYGLINYAAAYVAFFTAFCTLGINSVIVKEFVDNPGKEGEIIGSALGLRTISSVLSCVTIIAISFILDAGEPITILIVALYSVGAIFHVFETFNYWFQSRLESKKTAIASLIAYTITAIYKVVLLITGQSVVWFALAMSVDYICVAIVTFCFYLKSHGGKLSFSWEYGKKLLKKSYHFILPGLMVAIYGQTDKIMLKQMLDEASVGYYATATALCSMWTFVLSAIIDSLVPVIMKTHKEDKQKYEQMNRLLYCIVFYISVFVSILFTFLGKYAISILYGKEFLPAVAPLRVITWYTAFSFLGVARNAWVVCEEKQNKLKYLYISSAVLNVALNFLFIPWLGATGAAIASLAAQVATTMIVPFLMKSMRQNSIMMVQAICFIGIKNQVDNSANNSENKIES